MTPQEARKELARRELTRRQSITKPIDMNPAERAISGRQSFIDVNNPITLESIQQHPFKETLRGIGGGLEVAEAIPADVALGLQRGVETGGKSILNIPSDIGKTFMGQRPAQYGDVYRGAGVPEPLAAGAGLLTASTPFTPSGEIGNLIGRIIGKPIVAGYKASKPALSGLLSFLSGTPRKATALALENPKLLSNKYIKRFGQKAGEAIEREKTPLINDPNAIIQSNHEMTSIGNDLGWYTPQGEYTAQLSSLTKPEQSKVLDWASRIDNGQGGVNFNEADKVIAEIDTSLNKFFDKRFAQNIPPITENFERQASHIRNVINEARKSQFPKVGEAIDQYAKFANEREAHRAFQRVRPRLQEAIGGGFGGVGIGLLLKSLPLGAAGFSLTSPAVQGQIIKNVSRLASTIASRPAVSTLSMKALAQRNKSR